MAEGGTVAPPADPAFGVGASLLRKEDARHLRGRGQFVADLKIPGTLEAAFVRSPLAHARIRGIEIMPEIRDRVFVAADLPGLLPLRAICDLPGWKHSVCPPLATDRVRFVGQPVAICLAPTREEAEDLAQSVLVEALRNVGKHARPSRVDVFVRRESDTFELEVRNDGVRPTRNGAQRESGAGMGLRLASFEALQQGGMVEFGATDDNSWRVRLVVPLAHAEATG